MGKVGLALGVGGLGGTALIAAVFAAGTGGPGSLPLDLAKGLIPTAYQPLVEEHGNACPGLSPALLAALLEQESGWNPKAQSHAEAQGIAQFIPGTWATEGLDGNGDGKRDVWDPEDAIPSAASYMCKNFEATKNVPGNPVTNALAAYNAGAGAVLNAGGVPPYKETQNYVKTITAAADTFTTATAAANNETTPATDPDEQRAVIASTAVNWAQTKLGTPYIWGGDGNDNAARGFDCSGLTKAAYKKAGITLPRVANDQWEAPGTHPARDELIAGDLVFFANNSNDSRSIHHVGIYVGGGYMLNAPRPGTNIRFDPIDLPDYYGALRPQPKKGTSA